MECGNRTILPAHLDELRASALSDATIDSSGIYSSSDPVELTNILGWQPPKSFAPAMVFPFPGGFARIKPAKPRTNKEGKPVKYEQPRGFGSRVYLPPGVADAIREPGSRVYITEGEKKSLSMTEHIGPTIGLCGVWNWTKKTKKGQERELIDDLAEIDWIDREVVIVFDADNEHKPQVELAQIELCRVLESRGAKTQVRSIDRFRDWGKGIDDQLSNLAIRNKVIEFVKSGCLSTDSKPQDLNTAKLNSLGKPGLYFCGSDTGSGKSMSDHALVMNTETSATCVPTHDECQETLERYSVWGIEAKKFPQLNVDTCQNLEKAKLAMAIGLSPSSAICPACKFKDTCIYRKEVHDAENAKHVILTHKRFSLTGGANTQNKDVLSVHEDIVFALRHRIEIEYDNHGMAILACKTVETAIQRVSNDIGRMNDQKRAWLAAAERTATWIRKFFQGDDDSFGKPSGMLEPPGVIAMIFQAIYDVLENEPIAFDSYLDRCDDKGVPLSEAEIKTRKAKLRKSFHLYLKNIVPLCVGKASGKFDTVTAIEGPPRRIIAERVARLPSDQTIWLQDATTSFGTVEKLIADPLGLYIVDVKAKPKKQIHSVYQLFATGKGYFGITKRTKPKTAARIVASLVRSLPEHQRPAGIICHQIHQSAIEEELKKLGDGYVAKIEHFFGTTTRGSNAWVHHSEAGARCRSLIVVGTPRLQPKEIVNRAAQHGDDPAELVAANFLKRYWPGRDAKKRIVVVPWNSYCHRTMDVAYRELVLAQLRQAIGRARICDPNGMPVIFVGNESLEGIETVCLDSGDLLSHPELFRHGTRVTKKEFIEAGLSESVARKAVTQINQSNCGLVDGGSIFLPWCSR